MTKNKTSSKSLLAVVAILAALFTLTPWGVQIDNTIFDSISTIGKDDHRTDEVVVVGIDEPSFQQLGLQWPWPRDVHAQLIQQLVDGGAKAIAFDLLFTEASSEQDDAALANAIKKAGEGTPIYLGTDFKAFENKQYALKTPIPPLPQFLEAGAQTGHVSIKLDADGFVRRLHRMVEGNSALALQATQGKFAHNTPLPDQFLINFAGGTSAISQASYYQALDAQNLLPADFFQDKIVFVGVRSLTASLPDQQSVDHHPTPLTRWKSGYTAGVMIHAFAAASAIEGSWITQFPRALASLIGLGLSGIFILVGVRDKPKYTAVLSLFALLASGFFAAWLLNARFLYLPILSLSLPIASVGLFSPYYNFLQERKQRQAIRKAFSSYVNQDIVRQIEEDPESLKLGGKQIDGTVLFMDMAGFSGLTETESPETMISFVNEFLSAMIEIGMAYGGTVERFLGDAIMLIWGAPTAEPDHARLACKCALEMSTKIDEIADIAEQRYGFRVSARIGINSGSMTAGNIGGAERFCYTVLGDSVNLAARFEAANKNYGSRIIIGKNTLQSVKHEFFARLIDITLVKGRESKEELYELLGYSDEIENSVKEASDLYDQALRARQLGEVAKAKSLLHAANKHQSLHGSEELERMLNQ